MIEGDQTQPQSATIENLDVLSVEQVPQALVLHDEGEIIGYVLTTPDRVYAIRRDGREVIQAQSLERFESFWLAYLGGELARPAPAQGSRSSAGTGAR